MTRNQIEYWNLQENKRHNVTTEAETGRHNLATEQETGRHNRATEGIDLGKLNESIRHNKMTENISLSSLAETQRHNIATEGLTGMNINLGYSQLAEAQRHNTAVESLTADRNQAQNAVDNARARLTNTQAAWEDYLNSGKLHVSKAEADKLTAEIDKVTAEINKIKSDISVNDARSIQLQADAVSKGMSGLQTGVKTAGEMMALLQSLSAAMH